MLSTMSAVSVGLEPHRICQRKQYSGRAQDKDNWTRGQTWGNSDTIHHNHTAGEALHGSGARILATTIQVTSNTTTHKNHTQQQQKETSLDPTRGRLTTAATMSAAAPAGGALPRVPENNLANMNRYKLKPPPFYNGDYSTFEEWKYKFTAYMGDSADSAQTYDTFWSTQHLDQQPHDADNFNTHLGLKCTDNCAFDSQFLLAQGQ